MAEAATGSSDGSSIPNPEPPAPPQTEEEDLEVEATGSTVRDEPTRVARRWKRKGATTGSPDAGNDNNNIPCQQIDEPAIPIQNLSSTQPSMRPASPLNFDALEPAQRAVSPHRARQPHASSPGLPVPPSPRMHSPASSQIFERDVQEDIAPAQASPSIPSHIKTENHIPPILDASSATLTDGRLDPDSVEIVTHNSHHPVCTAQSEQGIQGSWHEDAASNAPIEADDSASNYGGLDSADVKRLSFVSFADLVHGEHAETTDYGPSHNSTQTAGGHIPNPSHLGVRNRSPSPINSPTSSHGLGTSPPTTMSSPLRASETSPHRALRHPNSPGLSGSSPPPSVVGGELNVETMRQALRRTESGDLGQCRSQPMTTTDHSLDRERLFK